MYQTRFVRSYAAERAAREHETYHEQELQRLDDLIDETDIHPTEIDERLGQPDHWYWKNRNDASHEFSIGDLGQIYDLLSDRLDRDVPVRTPEHRIRGIRGLMEDTDVNTDDVEDALDEPRGWAEDRLGPEMSLTNYYRIWTFLESMDAILDHEDYPARV